MVNKRRSLSIIWRWNKLDTNIHNDDIYVITIEFYE